MNLGKILFARMIHREILLEQVHVRQANRG